MHPAMVLRVYMMPGGSRSSWNKLPHPVPDEKALLVYSWRGWLSNSGKRAC